MKPICFFILCSFLGISFLFAQPSSTTHSSLSSEQALDHDQATKDEMEEEADFSRDPFESGLKGAAPITRAEEPTLTEELQLQGFAISGKKATVVINGKTYIKGAPAKDGIEVIEVRRGEADIKWAGQAKTLKTIPKK